MGGLFLSTQLSHDVTFLHEIKIIIPIIIISLAKFRIGFMLLALKRSILNIQDHVTAIGNEYCVHA